MRTAPSQISNNRKDPSMSSPQISTTILPIDNQAPTVSGTSPVLSTMVAQLHEKQLSLQKSPLPLQKAVNSSGLARNEASPTINTTMGPPSTMGPPLLRKGKSIEETKSKKHSQPTPAPISTGDTPTPALTSIRVPGPISTPTPALTSTVASTPKPKRNRQTSGGGGGGANCEGVTRILRSSMGRSRVPHAPELGSSSNPNGSRGGNLESSSAGQGTNEGKRALYHCNYCNKDLTGKIRIKCATCSDFDLCIECFSVGVEVYPHKSNHPYRVMDNLSFPLISPDWNADEEMLLLEGLEMYGVENWGDVAEHVSTKSKAHCIEHYNNYYMSSPCYPLPDMSHVAGKNKDELIAMSKEQNYGKTGMHQLGKLKLDEVPESSRSSSKNEEAAFSRPPSNSTAEKSVRGKNSISSEVEGPSLAELSGYNPKRHEFDPEYDTEAEQLLVDMDFRDTDTEDERELKLRVLQIYNKRLDERKRRKDFIIERNLLQEDPFFKDLSPEEKEIYERHKVFMRFLSKEDYDQLVRTGIEEHRTRKRIEDLKEARAAGCRTSAQADRYLELKRRLVVEDNARRARATTQVAPTSRPVQRMNQTQGVPSLTSPRGGAGSYFTFQAGGSNTQTSTAAAATSSSSSHVWDIRGLPGIDLLSNVEKRLCVETRIIPSQYLRMSEILSVEFMKGRVTRKSDAHRLFRVDPSTTDRVYDMLIKKGLIPPES